MLLWWLLAVSVAVFVVSALPVGFSVPLRTVRERHRVPLSVRNRPGEAFG